jgi:hypothetical protein
VKITLDVDTMQKGLLFLPAVPMNRVKSLGLNMTTSLNPLVAKVKNYPENDKCEPSCLMKKRVGAKERICAPYIIVVQVDKPKADECICDHGCERQASNVADQN